MSSKRAFISLSRCFSHSLFPDDSFLWNSFIRVGNGHWPVLQPGLH